MTTPYDATSPLLGNSVVITHGGALAINDSSSPTPYHTPHHQDHDDIFSHAHGDDKKINSKYAIWNLFNDVLSPGTVALPFYIYQSGLVAGIILLVAFGLLTGYTLEEIYRMYKKYDKKSYPELCDHIFGKPGYTVVCVAIFCFNFGGVCAQLMLYGSVMPDLLTDFFGPHELFTKRNLILIGCLVFLPISFLKDIAKYTFTSFISVSCVIIISGLVVFRLIDKKTGDFAPPDNDPYAVVHSSVFEALGGLAYIYVCHDLSFNVINSLENPTLSRYRRVIGATMFGTVASCALIGISGYLLFYDKVTANILVPFPKKDVIATIGRFLLAIDVTLTIPFSCFMPRISIIAVLSVMGKRPRQFAQSTIGFSCITVFVLAIAVTIAILVNNLGDVFELVGGVSACTLAFLLPPLLVLKTGLRELSLFRKVMTIVTLACGLVVLLGSTIDIFL